VSDYELLKKDPAPQTHLNPAVSNRPTPVCTKISFKAVVRQNSWAGLPTPQIKNEAKSGIKLQFEPISAPKREAPNLRCEEDLLLQLRWSMRIGV
jgi:hypothetical protein